MIFVNRQGTTRWLIPAQDLTIPDSGVMVVRGTSQVAAKQVFFQVEDSGLLSDYHDLQFTEVPVSPDGANSEVTFRTEGQYTLEIFSTTAFTTDSAAFTTLIYSEVATV